MVLLPFIFEFPKNKRLSSLSSAFVQTSFLSPLRRESIFLCGARINMIGNIVGFVWDGGGNIVEFGDGYRSKNIWW